MKMASLSDVKNDLSRYVDRVRQGETVRILVRGLPAADLVPINAGVGTEGEEFSERELADLQRRGVIRSGAGGFPPELDKPGPKVKGGRAVEVLLDERRKGR